MDAFNVCIQVYICAGITVSHVDGWQAEAYLQYSRNQPQYKNKFLGVPSWPPADHTAGSHLIRLLGEDLCHILPLMRFQSMFVRLPSSGTFHCPADKNVHCGLSERQQRNVLRKQKSPDPSKSCGNQSTISSKNVPRTRDRSLRTDVKQGFEGIMKTTVNCTITVTIIQRQY